MQGAKAYILPAVAALLLCGWWVFGPDPDDTRAAPTPEAKSEDAKTPPPARPAGPLDRALDEALAGCGDLAAAGVTTLQARLVPGDDGNAAVASIDVTPPDATGDTVTCAKALAGTSLPTKAPVAAVTRTRRYPTQDAK